MAPEARHDLQKDPWGHLARELDAWADAGDTATFWWRDDDAVADGPKLQRLLALAETAPLALAVIPARLDESLVAALAATEAPVTVLQHGFAHLNHAPRGQGQGAWELGLHRGETAVLDELATGHDILAGSVGCFLPVITPPWNRIDPVFFPKLPGLGYRGVTAFGPRAAATPAHGLHLNHVHCDPVNWKKGRLFTGATKAIGQLAQHLADRRTGAADPAEATGLLTHHRDMDEGAWAFTARLLEAMAVHPAARLVPAPELFP